MHAARAAPHLDWRGDSSAEPTRGPKAGASHSLSSTTDQDGLPARKRGTHTHYELATDRRTDDEPCGKGRMENYCTFSQCDGSAECHIAEAPAVTRSLDCVSVSEHPLTGLLWSAAA